MKSLTSYHRKTPAIQTLALQDGTQKTNHKKVKEEEPSHHFLPGISGLNCQGDVIFLSESSSNLRFARQNYKKRHLYARVRY